MNQAKKNDILKELFNIGIGNATIALNKIIGIPVMISVPEVFFIPIDEAIEKLGPLDKRVISFYINISQGINASVLIVMDEDIAKCIVELMLKKEVNIDSDFFVNVLQEFANILTSHFINTISNLLKKRIILSVPKYARDMEGAIVDVVFADHQDKTLKVLFVTTELILKEARKMSFILIPNEDSVNEILENICH